MSAESGNRPWFLKRTIAFARDRKRGPIARSEVDRSSGVCLSASPCAKIEVRIRRAISSSLRLGDFAVGDRLRQGAPKKFCVSSCSPDS